MSTCATTCKHVTISIINSIFTLKILSLASRVTRKIRILCISNARVQLSARVISRLFYVFNTRKVSNFVFFSENFQFTNIELSVSFDLGKFKVGDPDEKSRIPGMEIPKFKKIPTDSDLT